MGLALLYDHRYDRFLWDPLDWNAAQYEREKRNKQWEERKKAEMSVIPLCCIYSITSRKAILCTEVEGSHRCVRKILLLWSFHSRKVVRRMCNTPCCYYGMHVMRVVTPKGLLVRPTLLSFFSRLPTSWMARIRPPFLSLLQNISYLQSEYFSRFSLPPIFAVLTHL